MLQNDQCLQGLYQRMSDTDPKIAMLVDQFQKRCQTLEMCSKQRVAPKLVGIHPSNRDDYGVSKGDVHDLGSGICCIGYVDSATRPAAMQEHPDKRVDIYTRLVTDPIPELATFTPGTVIAGSMANTQSNQFLCAVIDGCPSHIEDITTDGKLDRSKLERDAGMTQPLSEGMEWDMFRWEVEEAYPEFPRFLQKARNAVGMLQRQDNVFQLGLDIHKCSQKHVDESGKVMWDKVKSAVLLGRTQRSSSDEVIAVLKFVQKYGGGPTGLFVNDLANWSKMFFPAGRTVKTVMFDCVTDLVLDAAGKILPFLIVALIKVEASCPQTFVKQGMCGFVKDNDVKGLFTKYIKEASLANDVLSQARQCAKAANLQTITKHVGKLDCRVGMWALQHVNEKRYAADFSHRTTTVDMLGFEFVQDISVSCTQSITNPWATKPAHESGAAASGINYIEYDAEGNVNELNLSITQLTNKGYKAGVIVKHDKTNKHFQIISIMDGGVSTVSIHKTGARGCHHTTVEFEDMLMNYSPMPKLEYSSFNYPDKETQKSDEFKTMCVKAAITLCIEQLGREFKDYNLILRKQPSIAAFANTVFAKGDIVLVPLSRKVIVYDKEQDITSNVQRISYNRAVVAVASDFDEKHGIISPFWCVQSTDDDSKVNMKIILSEPMPDPLCDGDMNDKTKKKHMIRIPIMTNTVKIAKYDELLMKAVQTTKDEKPNSKRKMIQMEGINPTVNKDKTTKKR